MLAYRAVLFDFFGTLTSAVRRGAAHAAVAGLLGCRPEALVDVLDRSFYLRARGLFGGAEASLRWACAQVGVFPSDAALRAAVTARAAAVRADTRLRPDAVSVLRRLRARSVRTGLVSDCTHELPTFLPRLPVAPLLDAQTLSVEFGSCKPDPAIYLATCRKLRIPPSDCLYVGDGGSQELSGAQRAGMTAVRLAAPDLADHLVFDPDDDWRGLAVRSLTEVANLVEATIHRSPQPDHDRGSPRFDKDRAAPHDPPDIVVTQRSVVTAQCGHAAQLAMSGHRAGRIAAGELT